METSLANRQLHPKAGPVPGDNTKAQLERVVRLLKKRAAEGELARDFFTESLRWMRNIRGSSHLALRLECGQELFTYFYGLGDGATLLAAKSFAELAARSNDKAWLRKAQCFALGADLLSHSGGAQMRCAELLARHHHERWDGQGYPARMSGKRIPIECRIVALADCFDAMTHGRPHLRPVSSAIALAEIELGGGRQFAPELAGAFTIFVRQLLVGQGQRLSAFLEATGRRSSFDRTMRDLGNLIAALPRSLQ